MSGNLDERLRALVTKWIRQAEHLRTLEGGYEYYKGEIIRLETCAGEVDAALGALPEASEPPRQCNGPFGDEEACPIHGEEIKVARGKTRPPREDIEALALVAKWRSRAIESRKESGRIRRTVNVATEAESNCLIRAEVWDDNANELESALAALPEASPRPDQSTQILDILDELTPEDAGADHPAAIAYQRVATLLLSDPKKLPPHTRDAGGMHYSDNCPRCTLNTNKRVAEHVKQATRALVDEEAEKGQPSAAKLVEECGVLLAEAELECGHKHRKAFAKLSQLRDAVRSESVPVEKGQPDGWPECREFYELMQTYRHTPVSDPPATIRAYEAVKAWVRTEAARAPAPTIEEIGLGDVAWGIAKRAIDEKWDDAKLGQAIAKFAIAVRTEAARAQGLHDTGER